MSYLTQDQSNTLASICDLETKMAYLCCNDWSSEAPMRACECHPDSPMLCCKAAGGPGPQCSRVTPARGPVRIDAVSSVSSASGPHLEKVAPLNGRLDQEEFLADAFRIKSFKVAECQNKEPHDWTLCVFAHSGEKARRRDPAVHKYVATACPDFRKGTCKRGDVCPFAHGVFESWLHPGKYRTQLCKDGVQCNRPVCFFAHTMQQLRLGSLPKSLDSADGAHFAAYYGGPAYGRMHGPSHGQASIGEPSSPDASSASGESSMAMLEGCIPGSCVSDEIEWLHGSHKDQLRRLAAMSVNTSACQCPQHPNTGLGEILPPALQASLKVQLAAFLLGDSNASSTAMRSAAQLVQLLEPLPLPAKMAMSQCLPALPTGLPSMPLPASQGQACDCQTARHQMPMLPAPAPSSSLMMSAASACMMSSVSSSSLPVTVPPLLASIWGPLPTGRPSSEWQHSSKAQPQQATAVPKKLPLSPEHRQCSAY